VSCNSHLPAGCARSAVLPSPRSGRPAQSSVVLGGGQRGETCSFAREKADIECHVTRLDISSGHQLDVARVDELQKVPAVVSAHLAERKRPSHDLGDLISEISSREISSRRSPLGVEGTL